MLIIIALIIIGCTVSNEQKASQYKLDLQYYQYAISFMNKNMNDNARASCERAVMLRSECFTSYVQTLLSKDIPPMKADCDAIHPEERMGMNWKSFELVYGAMEEELKKELQEKLRPSPQRIQTIARIKEA